MPSVITGKRHHFTYDFDPLYQPGLEPEPGACTMDVDFLERMVGLDVTGRALHSESYSIGYTLTAASLYGRPEIANMRRKALQMCVEAYCMARLLHPSWPGVHKWRLVQTLPTYKIVDMDLAVENIGRKGFDFLRLRDVPEITDSARLRQLADQLDAQKDCSDDRRN